MQPSSSAIGEQPRPLRPRRSEGRRLLAAALLLLLVAFVSVGFVGVYHYARGYWLYRGFPPPRDPPGVAAGTTEKISVTSAALGGRHQPVSIYLPPGYYAHPGQRYPVFYLLHGFPGRPSGFLLALRMGVLEDVMIASHKIRPMILAMPFGSSGTFTDKEWANGVHRGDGWETFVARDVVRAVDKRYRTIPTGRARALGGLSEGGYAALNIGLHHPREFHVLESWTGYVKADKLKSIFGDRHALLIQNSPLYQVPGAARAARRAGLYIWLYSATDDRYRHQDGRFADALTQSGVRHHYFLVKGGHNFAVWRAEIAAALVAASSHVAP